MRLPTRQQKLFKCHWFNSSFIVLPHIMTYSSRESVNFLKFRLNGLVSASSGTSNLSYNCIILHEPSCNCHFLLFYSRQTWIACHLSLGGLLAMLKILWGKLHSIQAVSLSWIFFAQCGSLGAASLMTASGDGCYFCTDEHHNSTEKMWSTYLQLQSCIFNSILLVPYNNIVSHTALGIPIKNPVDDITGSNACQSTITKKWNKNISLRIFTESKFWIWMQVFTLTVSVAIVHSVREQKTSVLCAWNWRNTDQGWGRGKGSCACSEKSEELEEIFSEIILQVSWGESKEKSQFVMSNPRSQKGFTV